MLQRLYIHNFRTFQNFEFKPNDTHSSLIIGKNGAGKSSIGKVLAIFQSIGRGENRVGRLISGEDFFLRKKETDSLIRLEIEVKLEDHLYKYTLALDLPARFKELRILEERLDLDGNPIFARTQAKVTTLNDRSPNNLSWDWHLIGLPLIHAEESNPINIFKKWLGQMVIISPIPQLMEGESTSESLWPDFYAKNTVDWLAGLLGQYPSAYTAIDNHIKGVMPDLKDFKYENLGSETKRLVIRFSDKKSIIPLPFNVLSDGEKCFFLCAIILAANEAYGPIFCFWDEPDNYLSLAEVGHFILHLRRAFEGQGQIVMTTHNEEAIHRFSDENTWVLGRKSHLEPTQIRLLEEIAPDSDVIQALMLGELDI